MLKWNDDGAREDARTRQPAQYVRSPSDLIIRLFPDAAVASSSCECLENSLLNSRKNRVEFSWETTENTSKTGLKSVLTLVQVN